MKKVFLFLVVFSVLATPCFAQCVGQIVGFSKGENGEILMEARYTVDGVQEPENDVKTYFPEQIQGKTKAQVMNKLRLDIEKRWSLDRDWETH